jgi:hypothetical protein
VIDCACLRSSNAGSLQLECKTSIKDSGARIQKPKGETEKAKVHTPCTCGAFKSKHAGQLSLWRPTKIAASEGDFSSDVSAPRCFDQIPSASVSYGEKKGDFISAHRFRCTGFEAKRRLKMACLFLSGRRFSLAMYEARSGGESRHAALEGAAKSALSEADFLLFKTVERVLAPARRIRNDSSIISGALRRQFRERCS